MKAILTRLNGKKTYIVALTAGILAALQSLGIDIPPMVYMLLGSVGLATVRSAVKKAEVPK